MPLQSDGNSRVRQCGENVPCFGLAIRLADRARKGIVGVNLDRQWLAGKQQFEQQGRGWRIFIDALKPQLTDCVARTVNAAPGMEIGDAPWLAHDLHRGMFDGHRLS